MPAGPEGAPQPVDVRDLNSVRRALRALLAREEAGARDAGEAPRGTDPER